MADRLLLMSEVDFSLIFLLLLKEKFIWANFARQNDGDCCHLHLSTYCCFLQFSFFLFLQNKKMRFFKIATLWKCIMAIKCELLLLKNFFFLPFAVFCISLYFLHKTHKFLLPSKRCVSSSKKKKKLLKMKKFQLKNITRKLVVYRHVSIMDSNGFIFGPGNVQGWEKWNCQCLKKEGGNFSSLTSENRKDFSEFLGEICYFYPFYQWQMILVCFQLFLFSKLLTSG